MNNGIEQIAGVAIVVAFTITLLWWNFGKLFMMWFGALTGGH